VVAAHDRFSLATFCFTLRVAASVMRFCSALMTNFFSIAPSVLRSLLIRHGSSFRTSNLHRLLYERSCIVGGLDIVLFGEKFALRTNGLAALLERHCGADAFGELISDHAVFLCLNKIERA
jgi:hypothetical protein